MSRWWIIAHGDGDGISSAAIGLLALRDVRNIYFSHPAGLKEDLSVVERGESVLIVDIALSSGDERKVISELRRIHDDGGDIIYIDHHPLPPELDERSVPGAFVHDECCSASELSYKYLSRRFKVVSVEERELEKIALYGAISDYLDSSDWAQRALNNWDKRYIYYEAGVLSQGLEGMRKYHDLKREIVKSLASGRDPSSISEIVVNSIFMSRNEKLLIEFVSRNLKTAGKIAYVEDPPGSIPRAATYARAISGMPVGAAVERRKDMAVMSLRAVDASMKINEIAMKIAPRLGGNAGGHPLACGARIPIGRMAEFFELISEAISR
ncbi:MAG: DHHA1 domain-containing protein [Fervidicoccaceae archaeon]